MKTDFEFYLEQKLRAVEHEVEKEDDMEQYYTGAVDIIEEIMARMNMAKSEMIRNTLYAMPDLETLKTGDTLYLMGNSKRPMTVTKITKDEITVYDEDMGKEILHNHSAFRQHFLIESFR